MPPNRFGQVRPANPAAAFFACHALQRLHRLGIDPALPQHRLGTGLQFGIGAEEGAGLGAERGLFRRIVEVHDGNPLCLIA